MVVFCCRRQRGGAASWAMLQTFAGILWEFQSLLFGEDELGEPLLYKRTSEIIKRLSKCRRKLGG